MSKAIELKKIRVREGHTGFYTSILESGTIAMIPADQKATKNGWFDDVEDDDPVDIGAANVGRKNETDQGAETGRTSLGGVGGSEELHGKSDSKDASKDQNTDQGNTSEDGQDADGSKDPTKKDIIEELESLGVQDFNRSARKDELQARLDLVKEALASQGE